MSFVPPKGFRAEALAPQGVRRRLRSPRWSRSARLPLNLACLIVLSFLSYFFVSHFVMTTVQVSGVSMFPTLRAGELVLLNRWCFFCRAPQRGDLVVLKDPKRGDHVIKRIVALPFETVQMQKNIVHVNGQRLEEPYLAAAATEDALLERGRSIAKDHYFVLGDNRNNSEDSRCYGAVPRRNILGLVHLDHQPVAFFRPYRRAPAPPASNAVPVHGITVFADDGTRSQPPPQP